MKGHTIFAVLFLLCSLVSALYSQEEEPVATEFSAPEEGSMKEEPSSTESAKTADEEQDPAISPAMTAEPAEAATTSSAWFEELGEGLFAQFNFGKLSVVVELFYKEMPVSVTFFTGLAAAFFDQQTLIDRNRTQEEKKQEGREFEPELEGTAVNVQENLPDAIRGTDVAVQEGNGEEKFSAKLYDGAPILEYIPNYVLYADVHEESPLEYSAVTFKQERYFRKNIRSGEGYLALVGKSPVESSSKIALIFSSLEAYPFPLPVIGKIKSEFKELDGLEYQEKIDTVVIKAVGSSAERFIRQIKWQNFFTQKNELNSKFHQDREAAIRRTETEIEKEKAYRKSAEGLYFTFTEGALAGNIEYISRSGYVGNALVESLNADPLEISQLVNSRLLSGKTVYFDYSVKVYKSDVVVDSSFERESAMRFDAGAQRILRGLKLILTLMVPEQAVKAIIPPALGYGEQGLGSLISPTDFLEVELSMLEAERP